MAEKIYTERDARDWQRAWLEQENKIKALADALEAMGSLRSLVEAGTDIIRWGRDTASIERQVAETLRLVGR